jgi:hypothetical protein
VVSSFGDWDATYFFARFGVHVDGLDPRNFDFSEAMISSWFSVSLEVATHTVAVVCVFEGVRRICAFGVSKSAVLSATFGLIYCFGYAGLSYWAHNVQHEASVILHRGANIPELPIDWGANLPPQQRANSSHEIAEAAFSEHGQLKHYFDAAGARLLFSPTQVDLDHRGKKITQLAKLEFAADESSDSYVRWILVALFASLLGIWWSRWSLGNPLIRQNASP